MALSKPETPNREPEVTQASKRVVTLQKIVAIKGTMVHPVTGQVFPHDQPVELEEVDPILLAQIREGYMKLV